MAKKSGTLVLAAKKDVAVRAVPPNDETSSGTNLVLLTGAVSREVRQRALATGEEALEFAFRCDDHSRALVPVVWPSPPKWAMKLQADDELVLLGSIRRRFFSVGGVRQTRTEVAVERGSRRTSAGAQTIWETATARLAP
jgi:hypothetical protein